jgi:hypothetical protein
MKITKVLIQTDRLNPPDYLVKMNMRLNEDWKYEFYSDEDALNFITNNPIEEFSEASTVFKSFKTGPHKSDFFRYYYLYLRGGVYIDSDFLLKGNLNDIVKDYEFFCVKSMLNNDSIFNGFIGCESKNKIIYMALKNLYFLDKKILDLDYFYNCKNLNNIVENYKSTINSIYEKINDSDNKTKKFLDKKIKMYNEQLVRIHNNSTRIYKTVSSLQTDKESVNLTYTEIIDENNQVLGIHYFAKNVINPDFQIPDKKLKDISETKICLTLDLPDKVNDLFCNGIRQNVLYLGELLLNIGYDTFFSCNKPLTKELTDKMSYDSRFKFIPNEKILSNNFDVVISIGYELELNIIKILKLMKTKIVSYNCGNNYIIDSECMLYNQHPSKKNQVNYIKKNDLIPYDIIWSIPQMTNTNQYYWSTLMRTKCIEVPFVWSNSSIKLAAIAENKTYTDFLYVNKGNEKKIVIFEPNISIMKWCGPSLLVCENAYRKYVNDNKENDNKNEENKIKQVFVNNMYNKGNDKSINTFNMDAFTLFVNNLDLCVDGKISIEARFNSLLFISTFADIVVSHQWENNLNYLYFDMAWMGWPIVHNASLCKDVGYYYDQFNYEEGGNKLIDCLNNHDKNINEYMIRNRQAIDKYLTTNKELQEKYKILISNLFEVKETSVQIIPESVSEEDTELVSKKDTESVSEEIKEIEENIKIEFNNLTI